jgi:hypothetical protein
MPRYYGFFLVPGMDVVRVCAVQNSEEQPADSEEYMWALVTEELEAAPMNAVSATIVDGVLVVAVDGATVSSCKEATLKTIREQRDKLLQACDWTQAKDSPLSDEVQAAWAAYRQTLRDLPSSLTNEQLLNGKVEYPELPK